MKERAMLVAGIMSGTSADGVDVALARILPRRRPNRIHLEAHEQFAYPAGMRRAVLASMDARSFAVADLSRLHTRLGMFYAECVAATAEKHRLWPELIGCHGQTIYHQSAPSSTLGANVTTTLQIGDPAPIVERMRVPVVSDFRPADMAAGGQGAPLVPLLDFEFFRNPRRARVLQNLGGIGNLALIPPGAAVQDVLAFDTGPANMVMDALAQQLFDKPYDRNGALAARGIADGALVNSLLRADYFHRPPPKSCGREQFGAAYVARFLAAAKRKKLSSHDTLATATLLTARSLRVAAEQFLETRTRGAKTDYILSGGGARNTELVRMIAEELAPHRFHVATAEAFGMDSAAKEAIAFALLAWNTWHGLPGNLPAATGARRPVVLGRISHA